MKLPFIASIDFRAAQTQVSSFAGKIQGALGGALSAVKGIGADVGAALAGGAAGLNALLSQGSEMEGFATRLTTLMGSSGAAQARMSELFDFASKTPFDLAQVVGAETTLRGFGAAAQELMPGLIDFAATTGTDLSNAATDFGKAWSQGATGLESDGGKILRKQIEIRSGMDATKMSIKDFRAAMLETLDEGMFAGGADRLSKTFSGMVLNLQDEWSRFEIQINDAGLFNNVKGGLQTTLELIAANRDGITLWAEAISSGLWTAIKVVAYSFAYATDAVSAMGLSILQAKVGVQDFGAVTVVVLAKAVEGWSYIAEALGNEGMQAKFHEASMSMEEWGRSAHESANATRKVISQFEEGDTAVTAVESFFGRAEAAAASYRAEAEAMSGPEKLMGDTANSGKAGKKGKDHFADELSSALDFSDEMKRLNESDTEKVVAEYQSRLDELQYYEDQGLISGQLAADTKLAIEQDYRSKLQSIYDENYKRLDEQRQADIEKERQAAQAKREMAYSYVGYFSNTLGAIDALLDQSNAKQKAAHKKIAIGQIIVSGFVAAAKAFEQFGFPAGLVPAGLVAAQTGLQIAGVQKAHQGGIVRRHQGGPSFGDELMILRSEIGGMLNSQATQRLGEQGVAALNAGGGGPQVVVVQKIGRLESSEITRIDAVGGGPLYQKIQSNRTSKSLDTGLRGRPAIG